MGRGVDVDRDLSQIGLSLHQDSGAGQSAVDAEPGEGSTEALSLMPHCLRPGLRRVATFED